MLAALPPPLWPASRVARRPRRAVLLEPLANARNLNVESNFEYGSRVGFWEIMRILREHGIDATIYAVGMALERNPLAVAEIVASGFEVACHGQRWIDYQFIAEETERADMLRNIDVITRLIGKRPCGGTPAQAV